MSRPPLPCTLSSTSISPHIGHQNVYTPPSKQSGNTFHHHRYAPHSLHETLTFQTQQIHNLTPPHKHDYYSTKRFALTRPFPNLQNSTNHSLPGTTSSPSHALTGSTQTLHPPRPHTTYNNPMGSTHAQIHHVRPHTSIHTTATQSQAPQRSTNNPHLGFQSSRLPHATRQPIEDHKIHPATWLWTTPIPQTLDV